MDRLIPSASAHSSTRNFNWVSASESRISAPISARHPPGPGLSLKGEQFLKFPDLILLFRHFTTQPLQFFRLGRVNRLASAWLGDPRFTVLGQLLAPLLQRGVVQPFLTQQCAKFATNSALLRRTKNAELVFSRERPTTTLRSHLSRLDVQGRCGTRWRRWFGHLVT